jgi:hypothetical protein
MMLNSGTISDEYTTDTRAQTTLQAGLARGHTSPGKAAWAARTTRCYGHPGGQSNSPLAYMASPAAMLATVQPVSIAQGPHPTSAEEPKISWRRTSKARAQAPSNHGWLLLLEPPLDLRIGRGEGKPG